MKKILTVRKKIDELDMRIFKLLKNRYDLINKIRILKKKNKLPVNQKQREKIQLGKLNKLYNKDQKAFKYIRKIFKCILQESKHTQKTGLYDLQTDKKMIK